MERLDVRKVQGALEQEAQLLLVQKDIQKQIQLDLDKLDRWAKTRDAAVLERVAGLKQQLDTAKKEHQQAVQDLQREYATEVPKAAPTISIRELVEGRLTLENVFSIDDFLGTETAKEEYGLESSDLDELNKRKDEIAKQIQAGLSSIFKQTLDDA